MEREEKQPFVSFSGRKFDCNGKKYLEKGDIVIGSIHKQIVRYTGMDYVDSFKTMTYQFEYVKYTGPMSGYGQTQEQFAMEEYDYTEMGQILYGNDK